MKAAKKLYENYKMTELGLLPVDWEVKPLFSIATLQRGKDLPKQSQIPGEYPIIGSNGIIGYHNKFTCEGPGVVTGRSGSIGRVTYVASRYWAHNTSLYVKDFHGNNEKFIYYLMHILDFKKYASGVSVPTLNRNSIHTQILPLPPFSEQKQIATVLSVVQEAKEKTENVIRATKELKKSLMKHLFTYGPVSVNEAEKVKLKETEIGLMPEKWEIARLGDVVIKTEQKNPATSPEKEFKYIDVSGIDRHALIITEYSSLLGKVAPSRARKLVEKGDVIFATVRPTLKRVAIINELFKGQICSTAFCVLRADKGKAIPSYIFHMVSRDGFVNELGKIQRGASYPAVTDANVKNQRIPLPPLSEQQQIAQILSAIDEKIASEEKKKKALDELFKSLLHNLMTGQVRVEDMEAVA